MPDASGRSSPTPATAMNRRPAARRPVRLEGRQKLRSRPTSFRRRTAARPGHSTWSAFTTASMRTGRSAPTSLSSTTTTSMRHNQFGMKGAANFFIPAERRAIGPKRFSKAIDAMFENSPDEDQDPDREGLQLGVREADRRHRFDRALDPVRGVLHPLLVVGNTWRKCVARAGAQSSRS